MPMSPRLLRPIASGVHPEAAAWRSAVVANGGSVSASTMKAVSAFCASIDAASIRDRFYRLNLFCGDSDASLIAPRVPLYRGPSRTGTQYGNTLDLNSNFVAGDYSETTGLTGNGSTKYLACSASPISTMFPAGSDRQTGHLSAWFAAATTAVQRMIGATGVGTSYEMNASTVAVRPQLWGTRPVSRQATASPEHWLNRRNASGQHALYVNGSPVSTSSGGSTTLDITSRLCVFAGGDENGGQSAYFQGRVLMYSFGESMDDTQASDFYSAVSQFFSQIGRA